MGLHVCLLVFALACFLFAAFAAPPSRIAFALGLAAWVLWMIVG